MAAQIISTFASKNIKFRIIYGNSCDLRGDNYWCEAGALCRVKFCRIKVTTRHSVRPSNRE